MKNASQLLQEMNNRLQVDSLEQLSAENIKTAIDIVAETLALLKQYILSNPFSTEKEEIEFFKKIKPQFDGKIIFYLMLLKVTQCQPMASLEDKRVVYQKELDKVQPFYDRYYSFWLYYSMGYTYMDKQYFLRSNQIDMQFIQEDSMYYDHLTNAPMSSTIAKFYAYNLFRDYIKQAMTPEQQFVKSRKTIKWNGPKVALVEFGYACKEAGLFDESLEDFFVCLGGAFNIEIKNPTRTFQEILSRKLGETVFLEKLVHKLKDRIDRINDRPSKK